MLFLMVHNVCTLLGFVDKHTLPGHESKLIHRYDASESDVPTRHVIVSLVYL